MQLFVLWSDDLRAVYSLGCDGFLSVSVFVLSSFSLSVVFLFGCSSLRDLMMITDDRDFHLFTLAFHQKSGMFHILFKYFNF